MSLVILPGALDDLLRLQDYMLDRWSESAWLRAEEEIFAKLESLQAGRLTGVPIPELAQVGMLDYRHAFTSHHKLVYRLIEGDLVLYVVVSHRQDYPTVLQRRLFLA